MSNANTIEIPQSVLISAERLDDLEDWMESTHPAFLEDIRRIRNNEDITDKGKDLSEILERWPTE